MLWLAARDRRTPWQARLICALSAAYIFSPVQLLPDFLPVVGYLDDALVLALGGWAALKLMPRDLRDELRAKAQVLSEQPVSFTAAAVILLIWIGVSALVALIAWRWIGPLLTGAVSTKP